MRHWVVILLLGLATLYLGATSLDRCAEGRNDDCAPVCHMLCADGCATVPVSQTPAPPVHDAAPQPRFEPERVVALVSLEVEPEKDPPRA